MRTPSPAILVSTLALAVAAALIIAAPSEAATPTQVVRAQSLTITKLAAQLAKTKRDDASKIKALTSDLTTRTAERDAAVASLATQVTLTGQAAAGALTGLSPDQLWGVVGALYTLLPNSDSCGYGRSSYASGSYTSFTFTRYVC